MRSARRIYIQFGLRGLLARGFGFVYRRGIRPWLPTVAHARYNDVAVVWERKLFDTSMPQLCVPSDVWDMPDYEGALVDSLKKYTCEGEKVLIIGGGVGVTAVVAAQQVGSSGSVLCYEGARECVDYVKRAARLNGVEDRVTVRHAVVAKAISLRGAKPENGVISPADLPQCDLLELDCEGAELEILCQMKIRPRVILVETHGALGASTQDVDSMLRRLSYNVHRIGVAENRHSARCERDDIFVLAAVFQPQPIEMGSDMRGRLRSR